MHFHSALCDIDRLRNLPVGLALDEALEDLPLPVTDPVAQSFRPVREGYYEVGAQLAHLVQARI